MIWGGGIIFVPAGSRCCRRPAATPPAPVRFFHYRACACRACLFYLQQLAWFENSTHARHTPGAAHYAAARAAPRTQAAGSDSTVPSVGGRAFEHLGMMGRWKGLGHCKPCGCVGRRGDGTSFHFVLLCSYDNKEPNLRVSHDLSVRNWLCSNIKWNRAVIGTRTVSRCSELYGHLTLSILSILPSALFLFWTD